MDESPDLVRASDPSPRLTHTPTLSTPNHRKAIPDTDLSSPTEDALTAGSAVDEVDMTAATTTLHDSLDDCYPPRFELPPAAPTSAAIHHRLAPSPITAATLISPSLPSPLSATTTPTTESISNAAVEPPGGYKQDSNTQHAHTSPPRDMDGDRAIDLPALPAPAVRSDSPMPPLSTTSSLAYLPHVHSDLPSLDNAPSAVPLISSDSTASIATTAHPSTHMSGATAYGSYTASLAPSAAPTPTVVDISEDSDDDPCISVPVVMPLVTVATMTVTQNPSAPSSPMLTSHATPSLSAHATPSTAPSLAPRASNNTSSSPSLPTHVSISASASISALGQDALATRHDGAYGETGIATFADVPSTSTTATATPTSDTHATNTGTTPVTRPDSPSASSSSSSSSSSVATAPANVASEEVVAAVVATRTPPRSPKYPADGTRSASVASTTSTPTRVSTRTPPHTSTPSSGPTGDSNTTGATTTTVATSPASAAVVMASALSSARVPYVALPLSTSPTPRNQALPPLSSLSPATRTPPRSSSLSQHLSSSLSAFTPAATPTATQPLGARSPSSSYATSTSAHALASSSLALAALPLAGMRNQRRTEQNMAMHTASEATAAAPSTTTTTGTSVGANADPSPESTSVAALVSAEDGPDEMVIATAATSMGRISEHDEDNENLEGAGDAGAGTLPNDTQSTVNDSKTVIITRKEPIVKTLQLDIHGNIASVAPLISSPVAEATPQVLTPGKRTSGKQDSGKNPSRVRNGLLSCRSSAESSHPLPRRTSLDAGRVSSNALGGRRGSADGGSAVNVSTGFIATKLARSSSRKNSMETTPNALSPYISGTTHTLANGARSPLHRTSSTDMSRLPTSPSSASNSAFAGASPSAAPSTTVIPALAANLRLLEASAHAASTSSGAGRGNGGDEEEDLAVYIYGDDDDRESGQRSSHRSSARLHSSSQHTHQQHTSHTLMSHGTADGTGMGVSTDTGAGTLPTPTNTYTPLAAHIDVPVVVDGMESGRAMFPTAVLPLPVPARRRSAGCSAHAVGSAQDNKNEAEAQDVDENMRQGWNEGEENGESIGEERESIEESTKRANEVGTSMSDDEGNVMTDAGDTLALDTAVPEGNVDGVGEDVNVSDDHAALKSGYNGHDIAAGGVLALQPLPVDLDAIAATPHPLISTSTSTITSETPSSAPLPLLAPTLTSLSTVNSASRTPSALLPVAPCTPADVVALLPSSSLNTSTPSPTRTRVSLMASASTSTFTSACGSAAATITTDSDSAPDASLISTSHPVQSTPPHHTPCTSHTQSRTHTPARTSTSTPEYPSQSRTPTLQAASPAQPPCSVSTPATPILSTPIAGPPTRTSSAVLKSEEEVNTVERAAEAEVVNAGEEPDIQTSAATVVVENVDAAEDKKVDVGTDRVIVNSEAEAAGTLEATVAAEAGAQTEKNEEEGLVSDVVSALDTPTAATATHDTPSTTAIAADANTRMGADVDTNVEASMEDGEREKATAVEMERNVMAAEEEEPRVEVAKVVVNADVETKNAAEVNADPAKTTAGAVEVSKADAEAIKPNVEAEKAREAVLVQANEDEVEAVLAETSLRPALPRNNTATAASAASASTSASATGAPSLRARRRASLAAVPHTVPSREVTTTIARKAQQMARADKGKSRKDGEKEKEREREREKSGKSALPMSMATLSTHTPSRSRTGVDIDTPVSTTAAAHAGDEVISPRPSPRVGSSSGSGLGAGHGNVSGSSGAGVTVASLTSVSRSGGVSTGNGDRTRASMTSSTTNASNSNATNTNATAIEGSAASLARPLTLEVSSPISPSSDGVNTVYSPSAAPVPRRRARRRSLVLSSGDLSQFAVNARGKGTDGSNGREKESTDGGSVRRQNTADRREREKMSEKKEKEKEKEWEMDVSALIRHTSGTLWPVGVNNGADIYAHLTHIMGYSTLTDAVADTVADTVTASLITSPPPSSTLSTPVLATLARCGGAIIPVVPCDPPQIYNPRIHAPDATLAPGMPLPASLLAAVTADTTVDVVSASAINTGTTAVNSIADGSVVGEVAGRVVEGVAPVTPTAEHATTAAPASTSTSVSAPASAPVPVPMITAVDLSPFLSSSFIRRLPSSVSSVQALTMLAHTCTTHTTFAPLLSADIEALAAMAVVNTVADGTPLLPEALWGDTSPVLGIVLQGSVRGPLWSGVDAAYGKGEIIGDVEFLTYETPSASETSTENQASLTKPKIPEVWQDLRAWGSCSIALFTYSDIEGLCKGWPDTYGRLMKTIGAHVARKVLALGRGFLTYAREQHTGVVSQSGSARGHKSDGAISKSTGVGTGLGGLTVVLDKANEPTNTLPPNIKSQDTHPTSNNPTSTLATHTSFNSHTSAAGPSTSPQSTAASTSTYTSTSALTSSASTKSLERTMSHTSSTAHDSTHASSSTSASTSISTSTATANSNSACAVSGSDGSTWLNIPTQAILGTIGHIPAPTPSDAVAAATTSITSTIDADANDNGSSEGDSVDSLNNVSPATTPQMSSFDGVACVIVHGVVSHTVNYTIAKEERIPAVIDGTSSAMVEIEKMRKDKVVQMKREARAKVKAEFAARKKRDREEREMLKAQEAERHNREGEGKEGEQVERKGHETEDGVGNIEANADNEADVDADHVVTHTARPVQASPPQHISTPAATARSRTNTNDADTNTNSDDGNSVNHSSDNNDEAEATILDSTSVAVAAAAADAAVPTAEGDVEAVGAAGAIDGVDAATDADYIAVIANDSVDPVVSPAVISEAISTSAFTISDDYVDVTMDAATMGDAKAADAAVVAAKGTEREEDRGEHMVVHSDAKVDAEHMAALGEPTTDATRTSTSGLAAASVDTYTAVPSSASNDTPIGSSAASPTLSLASVPAINGEGAVVDIDKDTATTVDAPVEADVKTDISMHVTMDANTDDVHAHSDPTTESTGNVASAHNEDVDGHGDHADATITVTNANTASPLPNALVTADDENTTLNNASSSSFSPLPPPPSPPSPKPSPPSGRVPASGLGSYRGLRMSSLLASKDGLRSIERGGEHGDKGGDKGGDKIEKEAEHASDKTSEKSNDKSIEKGVERASGEGASGDNGVGDGGNAKGIDKDITTLPTTSVSTTSNSRTTSTSTSTSTATNATLTRPSITSRARPSPADPRLHTHTTDLPRSSTSTDFSRSSTSTESTRLLPSGEPATRPSVSMSHGGGARTVRGQRKFSAAMSNSVSDPNTGTSTTASTAITSSTDAKDAHEEEQALAQITIPPLATLPSPPVILKRAHTPSLATQWLPATSISPESVLAHSLTRIVQCAEPCFLIAAAMRASVVSLGEEFARNSQIPTNNNSNNNAAIGASTSTSGRPRKGKPNAPSTSSASEPMLSRSSSSTPTLASPAATLTSALTALFPTPFPSSDNPVSSTAATLHYAEHLRQPCSAGCVSRAVCTCAEEPVAVPDIIVKTYAPPPLPVPTLVVSLLAHPQPTPNANTSTDTPSASATLSPNATLTSISPPPSLGCSSILSHPTASPSSPAPAPKRRREEGASLIEVARSGGLGIAPKLQAELLCVREELKVEQDKTLAERQYWQQQLARAEDRESTLQTKLQQCERDCVAASDEIATLSNDLVALRSNALVTATLHSEHLREQEQKHASAVAALTAAHDLAVQRLQTRVREKEEVLSELRERCRTWEDRAKTSRERELEARQEFLEGCSRLHDAHARISDMEKEVLAACAERDAAVNVRENLLSEVASAHKRARRAERKFELLGSEHIEKREQLTKTRRALMIFTGSFFVKFFRIRKHLHVLYRCVMEVLRRVDDTISVFAIRDPAGVRARDMLEFDAAMASYYAQAQREGAKTIVLGRQPGDNGVLPDARIPGPQCLPSVDMAEPTRSVSGAVSNEEVVRVQLPHLLGRRRRRVGRGQGWDGRDVGTGLHRMHDEDEDDTGMCMNGMGTQRQRVTRAEQNYRMHASQAHVVGAGAAAITGMGIEPSPITRTAVPLATHTTLQSPPTLPSVQPGEASSQTQSPSFILFDWEITADEGIRERLCVAERVAQEICLRSGKAREKEYISQLEEFGRERRVLARLHMLHALLAHVDVRLVVLESTLAHWERTASSLAQRHVEAAVRVLDAHVHTLSQEHVHQQQHLALQQPMQAYRNMTSRRDVARYRDMHPSVTRESPLRGRKDSPLHPHADALKRTASISTSSTVAVAGSVATAAIASRPTHRVTSHAAPSLTPLPPPSSSSFSPAATRTATAPPPATAPLPDYYANARPTPSPQPPVFPSSDSGPRTHTTSKQAWATSDTLPVAKSGMHTPEPNRGVGTSTATSLPSIHRARPLHAPAYTQSHMLAHTVAHVTAGDVDGDGAREDIHPRRAVLQRLREREAGQDQQLRSRYQI